MRLSSSRDGAAPLDGVDVVLADLDGVVYRGADAVPHAVDALRAASASARVGYITNNASRTDAQVAEQLAGFGLDVAPTDVVTSPQAATRLLASTVADGARVLAIGGEGLVVELERAGYRVVRSADDAPAAVVQGFSPDLGWRDLAEASFALALAPGDTAGTSGIPWIATNTDWTIPVARGIAPGNGTLVSAVHSAVGRLPIVAGKPETPIFEEAVARFRASSPIFLGDRLDTDVRGARAAGIRSVFVLTGVDRPKQLLAAREEDRPDVILGDLRGLDEPYPATSVTGGRARVGRARVAVEGRRVVVEREGDPLDTLRAACAAVWSTDVGIHALDVPPALYADPPGSSS